MQHCGEQEVAVTAGQLSFDGRKRHESKGTELIVRLLIAGPDGFVVFLDSCASVYESDEIREWFIDSNVWTHETGVRYGECCEVRYPGATESAEGDGHMLTTQSLERVFVLSDEPTNLRFVTPFQPNEREQILVERALASHRWAQAMGRYAPLRLVRKWTSENPDVSNKDRFGKRKKPRFLGVSTSSGRSLMTVPVTVRNALRLRAGSRLWWFCSGDGFVSLKARHSRPRKTSES